MSNRDAVYTDAEVAELQEKARKLRAAIGRARVIAWVGWSLAATFVLFAFVGWQFIEPTAVFASIAAPALIVAVVASFVARIWGRASWEKTMLAITEANLAIADLDRAQRDLKRRR